MCLDPTLGNLHLLFHQSSKQPRKTNVTIPISTAEEKKTQRCSTDLSKVTQLVGGDARMQTNAWAYLAFLGPHCLSKGKLTG